MKTYIVSERLYMLPVLILLSWASPIKRVQAANKKEEEVSLTVYLATPRRFYKKKIQCGNDYTIADLRKEFNNIKGKIFLEDERGKVQEIADNRELLSLESSNEKGKLYLYVHIVKKKLPVEKQVPVKIYVAAAFLIGVVGGYFLHKMLGKKGSQKKKSELANSESEST